MISRSYPFTAQVWQYPGNAGWHFVTLPQEIAEEINYLFSMDKRGWGSLPVMVHKEQTSWETSIFPDKKSGSFVLPLKAEIRKKANIHSGDEIALTLDIHN